MRLHIWKKLPCKAQLPATALYYSLVPIAQPAAQVCVPCTTQSTQVWGLQKSQGCEAGINFLNAYGGCSCYWLQPGSNPILPNSKKRMSNNWRKFRESQESLRSWKSCLKTKASNKRRNQCIRLVKEETNAEHELSLSTETGNKTRRMALPACS